MNWTSDMVLFLLHSGKYDYFTNLANDPKEEKEMINTFKNKKMYKNDLNENDNDNMKPIHVAVETGFLKTVDALINYRKQQLVSTEQYITQLNEISQAQNQTESQVQHRQPHVRKKKDPLSLFLQRTSNSGKLSNKSHTDANSDKEEKDPAVQITYEEKMILIRKRGRELMNCNSIINSLATKMKWTPLIFAVQCYDNDLVSLLLKQKQIDPNIKDSIGRSALHFAVINGFTEIVRILLHKKGLFVNECSNEGMTPIHYACHKNHCDIVALLLKYQKKTDNPQVDSTPNRNKYYVDVNAITPWSRETPLHMVQSATCLNVLLSDGINVDINAVDRNGMTPLIVACKNMNHDVAKLLINLANLPARTCSSSTNFSKSNPIPLAELLSTSAVHNVQSSDNEFVPLDINIKDKNGKTALHYVCENADLELAQCLLEIKSIDINSQDKDGLTPIQLAIRNTNKELINLFLSQPNLEISNQDKEKIETLQ